MKKQLPQQRRRGRGNPGMIGAIRQLSMESGVFGSRVQGHYFFWELISPIRRGGRNVQKSRHNGVDPGADRVLRTVPSGERQADHDEEDAQGRNGQGVCGAADIHLDGPGDARKALNYLWQLFNSGCLQPLEKRHKYRNMTQMKWAELIRFTIMKVGIALALDEIPRRYISREFLTL